MEPRHREVAMSIKESQNSSHQMDVTLNYLGINFQLDMGTVIYVFKKSVPFHSVDVPLPMS